jgi:oligopeptidase B
MTIYDIEKYKIFEEIILDENKLAEGKKQCDVNSIENSDDHSIIAYSVDFTGDELYQIQLMTNIGVNTEPKLLECLVGDLDGSIEWKGNTHLFYVSRDKVKRCNRIWCHIVGTPQENDFLIFEENDELFSVDFDLLSSKDYLVITSSSSETSFSYLLNLNLFSDKNSLTNALKLVRPKEDDIRYSIEGIRDGQVFILTNIDDCPNNKVIIANINDLNNWDKVIINHSDDTYIDDVMVFETFSIVSGREDGLTQLWCLDKTNNWNSKKRIATDEEIYEIALSSNCEFTSKTAMIVYSSLKTPITWYEYDPKIESKMVIKRQEILNYDPNEYVCERLYATAPDNEEITISMVRRADLDMTKTHPTLLYGYGSYGICIEPEFSRKIIPYISRGVIYCIAHIRGGEENGREWYETYGKLLTKRNTFQDFISCAEELIEEGITTPSQLAINGRSAGGLLMGCVVNMRPDLFKVVVAGVPFVDVMGSMCDSTIPLTTGEWEEWGNPNEYKYFDYMLSYSPMNNIRNQPYPHILITAGLHDPRVAYWEPAKWASKLREHKTNENDVLLKVDMESGHFSASDRYKYLKEESINQAYVLHHILA